MDIHGLALEQASSSNQYTVQNATRAVDLAKDDSEKLEKIADEFEAMFIKLVLDSMKKTVDEKKNPFYGGLSEDIFSGMLYDEYASLIAQQSELGFSEAITQQYRKYV